MPGDSIYFLANNRRCGYPDCEFLSQAVIITGDDGSVSFACHFHELSPRLESSDRDLYEGRGR